MVVTMKSKRAPQLIQNACSCGSSQSYVQCCEPLHQGLVNAATAEALMRSRYSAYVLRLSDYVLCTWHASTRPQDLDLSEDSATKWLGLTVLRALDGDLPNEAWVEFVAKYKVGGQGAQRLHETSRFVHETGRWFYVDGVFAE